MANAVIVAAGSKSLHNVYTDVKRDYDVILLAFEDTDERGADKVYKKKGYKFHLIKDYFENNPLDLLKYDYFLFPDDDVFIKANEIEELFSLAKRGDMGFFHPAILPKNYWHDCMFRKPNFLSHVQNWSETMCIGMSRETVQKAIHTFDMNKSGYGLPQVWTQIFGKFCFNVIDTIEILHTRPLADPDSYYNQNGFGGLNEAMIEFKEAVKDLKDLEPPKIHKVVYDKLPLSVMTVYRPEDEDRIEELLNTIPPYAEKVLVRHLNIDVAEPDENGMLPKEYEPIIRYNKKGHILADIYVKEWDFAKAKNVAKSLCTGRWCLNLDADERLIKNQWDELLTVIENCPKDAIAFFVTIMSNMTAIKDANGLASRMPSVVIRLFKNLKEIEYFGNIHETVEESIEAFKGGKAYDSPVTIIHKGYECTKEELQEKCKRNIDMLWKNPELRYKQRFFDYMIKTCLFLKELGG